MRKLKKSLLILLFATTISSLTKAQETEFLAPKDLDTEIQKGDPAPFMGILVPPDHYREYSDAIRVEDFVNKDKNIASVELQKSDNSLYYLGGGLLVGIIVGVLISK